MSELNLKLDKDRECDDICSSLTGIPVRAQDSTGKWVSADISQLDEESLDKWLYASEGRPEAVVRLLINSMYVRQEKVVQVKEVSTDG